MNSLKTGVGKTRNKTKQEMKQNWKPRPHNVNNYYNPTILVYKIASCKCNGYVIFLTMVKTIITMNKQ